jgi:choline dehydrogenase
MRSGIGPAEPLKAHGIDVVHDLPDVGDHLQVHFGIGAEYESREKNPVNDIYINPLKGGRELLRYLLFRAGPFADNGNYSNTFIHTHPDISTPNMMVTFMAWCTGRDLKPRPFSGFTILAEHIRPDARARAPDRAAPDRPARDPVQFPRNRH